MIAATEDTIDLRARRLATGLSQESLARLVPCSTNSVRLFEKGYSPPASLVRDRVIAVLDALLNDREPDANGLPEKTADAGGGHGRD